MWKVFRGIRKFRPVVVNEPLGNPDFPFCYRSYIDFYFFSIRLHYWVGDDDSRAYHDHPYPMFIKLLKGEYLDISPNDDIYADGENQVWHSEYDNKWRFMPAHHKHRIVLLSRKVITLVIAGRKQRHWAFYMRDKEGQLKRVMRDKYFKEYGYEQG